VQRLRAAGLPAAETTAIDGGNAVRLGLVPTPVRQEQL
jgi:hypothetical protein